MGRDLGGVSWGRRNLLELMLECCEGGEASWMKEIGWA